MNDTIQLTDEQELAVIKIIAFLEPADKTLAFRFGGYAGTGKTTVIKALLDRLEQLRGLNVAVCAFTCKAMSVLQRKGIWCAQTLHSLIYECELQPGGGMEFHRKGRLVPRPDLIIVDEASMISTELYKDLMAFNIKVLFVGDPGQLEPVGDNPNLMKLTDYVLSKIHRQAEESPIITLATKIRGGFVPLRSEVEGCTIRGKDLDSKWLLAANQVIVAKNATRNFFNKKFRLYYQRQPQTLVVGEKIIVLRNNTRFSVFNGMILFVTKVHHETATYWRVDCVDELNKPFESLLIWKDPFQIEIGKDARIPRDLVYCDYAYAITCHKSQGSEWDSVLVYDEPTSMWDMKRWRYTAVTRAAYNLVYCI